MMLKACNNIQAFRYYMFDLYYIIKVSWYYCCLCNCFVSSWSEFPNHLPTVIAQGSTGSKHTLTLLSSTFSIVVEVFPQEVVQLGGVQKTATFSKEKAKQNKKTRSAQTVSQKVNMPSSLGYKSNILYFLFLKISCITFFQCLGHHFYTCKTFHSFLSPRSKDSLTNNPSTVHKELSFELVLRMVQEAPKYYR